MIMDLRFLEIKIVSIAQKFIKFNWFLICKKLNPF